MTLLQLTKSQTIAVEHPSGPLQIVAGPGTGKTRVLTAKTAHLLRNNPPGSIIVTTFTKKAAAELRNRLQESVPSNIDLSLLRVGTFHSICTRLLRQYGSRIDIPSDFKIADVTDQLHVIKSLNSPKPVAEIRNALSASKSAGKLPKDPELLNALKAYAARMKLLNALDFEDLLVYTQELLSKHPEVVSEVRFVLVDEFQDTCKTQLDLCVLLAQFGSLIVVGDPDQAIYGFRSAEPKIFEKMVSVLPDTKSVLLTESFRAPQGILDACSEILGKKNVLVASGANKSREDPACFTVYSSRFEESDAICRKVQGLVWGEKKAYKDISILVRTANQARELERSLLNHSIPYTVHKGASFWQRSEVAVVVGYLRLILDETDLLAMMRTLNVPPRGLGKKLLERIEHALEGSRSLSTLENMDFLLQKGQRSIKEYTSILRELQTSHDNVNGLIGRIWSRFLLDEFFAALGEAQENINRLKQELLEVEGEGGLAEFLQTIQLDAPSSKQDEADAVVVLTVHAAKGLEWPIVFVPLLVEGVFPHSLALQEGSEDEERRVLYVAASRAREQLYLSSYSTEEVSRFVKGMKRNRASNKTLPTPKGPASGFMSARDLLKGVSSKKEPLLANNKGLEKKPTNPRKRAKTNGFMMDRFILRK